MSEAEEVPNWVAAMEDALAQDSEPLDGFSLSSVSDSHDLDDLDDDYENEDEDEDEEEEEEEEEKEEDKEEVETTLASPLPPRIRRPLFKRPKLIEPAVAINPTAAKSSESGPAKRFTSDFVNSWK